MTEFEGAPAKVLHEEPSEVEPVRKWMYVHGMRQVVATGGAEMMGDMDIHY